MVMYMLLDVLPYITEVSFVFQELDFDFAIAQVLVNHCLSPPERHADDRHHGMRKTYSMLPVVNANCFENCLSDAGTFHSHVLQRMVNL